ncbi:hypothetical protein DP43_5474 [Burkholderia pseudomallei]|nr:hypothetical protein DP43_5474 [Burkholderia pseudomallei]
MNRLPRMKNQGRDAYRPARARLRGARMRSETKPAAAASATPHAQSARRRQRAAPRALAPARGGARPRYAASPLPHAAQQPSSRSISSTGLMSPNRDAAPARHRRLARERASAARYFET